MKLDKLVIKYEIENYKLKDYEKVKCINNRLYPVIGSCFI